MDGAASTGFSNAEFSVGGVHMISSLRVMVLGGFAAYRALFAWRSPLSYGATLLANPIFQVMFFVVAADTSSVSSDSVIIGASLMACCIPGIFGGAMAIGNERRFGTLANIVLSPRSYPVVFLGRCLPHVLNGTFSAGLVFLVTGSIFAHGSLLAVLPRLLAAAVCGTLSSSAVGLLIGVSALITKDIWLLSNVILIIVLMLSGAVVPARYLPGPLAVVSEGIPLHYAIAVCRGGPPSLLIGELIIATIVFLLSLSLLKLMSWLARSRGTLEIG